MIVKSDILCRCLLVISLILSFLSGAMSQDSHYVFSYFIGNGEDGLHLAYSTDGYKWTALNAGKSVLTPTVGRDKLMRDPSVIQDEAGIFHMVWTVSWGEKGIGYSSSKDLLTWSGQKYIPVMEHESSAKNCWAPELFYDDKMQLFYIFWATTISDRFKEGEEQKYNHRLYYVTTKDFKSFSDTQLFYNHNFSVIDAAIVKFGNEYIMFLKDETDKPFKPEKNIRIATSAKASGPYSAPGKPITGSYWAEGPSPILINGKWFVYFDKYTDHKYGVVVSTDLKSWTDESEKLLMPAGIRHGTAFKITAEVAAPLLKKSAR